MLKARRRGRVAGQREDRSAQVVVDQQGGEEQGQVEDRPAESAGGDAVAVVMNATVAGGPRAARLNAPGAYIRDLKGLEIRRRRGMKLLQGGLSQASGGVWPVTAAQPSTGGIAPEAPPMTMFWGVAGLRKTV